MRLHEADPDVVAYQEIRLQGKDNVVCTQMYDKEGREYQRECAQGLPLLVRRGLSVVEHKKVGARGGRAVYDVATQHGQVVVINCHVPHGRRVKDYVAQPRTEYVKALERGAGNRGQGLQLRSPEERHGDGGGPGSAAVCGGNAATQCVIQWSARPLTLPSSGRQHAVKD